jgi:hypothetical protein
MHSVGIVTFEISNIGGIATHASHTYKCLKKAGVETDLILLKQTNIELTEEEVREGATSSSLTTGGIVMSIHNKHVEKTCERLNKYDILFYTHACIHEEDANWLSIYKLKNPKHIVTISDIYWDKFYPYFDEAIPYITKFIATNAAAQEYLSLVKGIESELMIHPFIMEDIGCDFKKENIAIWANQWRGWKGINDWIAHIPKYEGISRMFGTGREYYNLRDKMAKIPNIDYIGNRPPADILNAYRTAKFNVDLTGRSPGYFGHYNRTTIEGMFYGAVTVCYRTLVYPFSHIPIDICLIVDRKNIAKKMNELQRDSDKFREISCKAFNWANKFYDYKKTVKQIVGKI